MCHLSFVFAIGEEKFGESNTTVLVTVRDLVQMVHTAIVQLKWGEIRINMYMMGWEHPNKDGKYKNHKNLGETLFDRLNQKIKTRENKIG